MSSCTLLHLESVKGSKVLCWRGGGGCGIVRTINSKTTKEQAGSWDVCVCVCVSVLPLFISP